MMARQEKLRRIRQKSFRGAENDGRETAEEETTRLAKEQEEFNPNAELLMPMTTEEKLDRKRKLEESLKPSQEAPISRTKRKRLEKYIVSITIFKIELD